MHNAIRTGGVAFRIPQETAAYEAESRYSPWWEQREMNVFGVTVLVLIASTIGLNSIGGITNQIAPANSAAIKPVVPPVGSTPVIPSRTIPLNPGRAMPINPGGVPPAKMNRPMPKHSSDRSPVIETPWPKMHYS
jgi:hypothetical protein